MAVKTRFLVISDTHGESFNVMPGHKADVVIHCGDLTDESKIDEYHQSLRLLEELDAPLKLVIAGNHDFTLDIDAFKAKIANAPEHLDSELVQKEYGDYGEPRRLFDESTGITFLDEGIHTFHLDNGASMTVYASPFTPSKGGSAFQFHPDNGHEFAMGKNIDVVITHGPPRGIMDMAHSERAGCPQLFAAVARCRPRMHCFGHIHEGWGARLVAWREETTESPSHFSDIDNSQSTVIDKLTNITETKFDTPETKAEKYLRAEAYLEQGYRATSHCAGDEAALQQGVHTLFVNAAVEE